MEGAIQFLTKLNGGRDFKVPDETVSVTDETECQGQGRLDRLWHLSFLALVEQEGDGADDDGEGN